MQTATHTHTHTAGCTQQSKQLSLLLIFLRRNYYDTAAAFFKSNTRQECV